MAGGAPFTECNDRGSNPLSGDCPKWVEVDVIFWVVSSNAQSLLGEFPHHRLDSLDASNDFPNK